MPGCRIRMRFGPAISSVSLSTGRELQPYDLIVGFDNGVRLAFTGATTLHYVAARGDSIYLVEETLK